MKVSLDSVLAKAEDKNGPVLEEEEPEKEEEEEGKGPRVSVAIATYDGWGSVPRAYQSYRTRRYAIHMLCVVLLFICIPSCLNHPGCHMIVTWL